MPLSTADGKRGRVMSKYDRDIQDVYAVKQLGDAIGYGHLMAIAHELWARHLESKGLPRRGAHCVVGYPMVKEQFQAEALNDKIYTIIVGKALEADRKTEPLTCDGNCWMKKQFGEWLCEHCQRKPKTEPNCSEKPNNCEHITEDGVTCAKYPACDDCLDNPLNKLKGSERLLKGKGEPQTERSE